ncbi:copper resistance CopC family protein [Limobrevibacterium gyesilva]|uniref:Copper resistance protein CopC n=1 Tax=Limobrevibacterium gyesilva TaxID=2991712 RepID=A0AA41YLM4_9PROT|nr:copper resistance CopC family protein [Limobrevibacterium gyesilva]MCW3474532.1 copper resistance protein CopC [Limobrevibacterium gyesilva]
MTFSWIRALVLPAAVAVPVALGLPAAARAHAILVESQPAIGGAVQAGPVAVSLRYNSRIDRARSRLTLNRPDKTQAVLPIGTDGPDDVLTTRAELSPGAYVLRWQVLAVDGHITRGDVPFTVAPPGAATVAP